MRCTAAAHSNSVSDTRVVALRAAVLGWSVGRGSSACAPLHRMTSWRHRLCAFHLVHASKQASRDRHPSAHMQCASIRARTIITSPKAIATVKLATIDMSVSSLNRCSLPSANTVPFYMSYDHYSNSSIIINRYVSVHNCSCVRHQLP